VAVFAHLDDLATMDHRPVFENRLGVVFAMAINATRSPSIADFPGESMQALPIRLLGIWMAERAVYWLGTRFVTGEIGASQILMKIFTAKNLVD
jgi:hypothetical protein